MRTPGPWEIIQLPSMEYRIDAKVGPLHVCPAIVHGLSDAHLIAAAPDLLVALAALVDTFRARPDMLQLCGFHETSQIHAACDALNKATTVTP